MFAGCGDTCLQNPQHPKGWGRRIDNLRSAWAVWCTVQPELYNPVVHFGLKLMTQERVTLSSGLPSAQGWDDRHAPLLLVSSKPFSNIAFVSFTQLCIFFFATLRISLLLWKSSCIAFIVCGGKIFSLAETKHQNCYSMLVGIKINQPGLWGSLSR